MKLKIDDVDYELMPVPPSLAPYQARINELMSQKPKSIEETKEISGELKPLIQAVLLETVSPKVRREHELAVFRALMKLTNETLTQVQFFPGGKRSEPEKGGAAGSSAAQAAQRDPEA